MLMYVCNNVKLRGLSLNIFLHNRNSQLFSLDESACYFLLDLAVSGSIELHIIK